MPKSISSSSEDEVESSAPKSGVQSRESGTLTHNDCTEQWYVFLYTEQLLKCTYALKYSTNKNDMNVKYTLSHPASHLGLTFLHVLA